MKKLIAVLAVFAMVTTAAFAQVSINGMMGFRADIVNGGLDFDDGMRSIGRGFAHESRFGMNVGNGEGTAGAGLRSWVATHEAEGGNQLHAWAWWQPMDSLRVTVGRDPWRIYAVNNIVGWAFNANGAEDWLLGWGAAGGYHYAAAGGRPRLGRNAGFYPGFGGTGISATFRPVEDLPLTVVAVLPFHDVDNEMVNTGHWAADTLLNAHLGVRYAFPGIGQLNFTWWGAPGHWGWGIDGLSALDTPGNVNVGALSGTNQTNSSRAYLSFLMTAVPGIQLNMGVVYTLPFTIYGHAASEELELPQQEDRTINFPVEVGLGFLYTQGPLRLAARMAVTLAGSQDVFDEDDVLVNEAIPLILGFNIAPRFDIGAVSLHLNAGVQFHAAHDGADDAQLAWHATPYVMRAIAGTRVFAGLHFYSNGTTNAAGETHFAWRVPVGLQFEW